MSPTALDVIAGVPLAGDTRFHVGPQTAALIVKALDDAGNVILRKATLQKELDDATASDNWHKYGEGYAGLRAFLERLTA